MTTRFELRRCLSKYLLLSTARIRCMQLRPLACLLLLAWFQFALVATFCTIRLLSLFLHRGRPHDYLLPTVCAGD